MKFLIINFGTLCETFISTCIIKGIYKNHSQESQPEIYWICNDQESLNILKYNKKIKKVYIKGEVPESLLKMNFDRVINLSPEFLPANDLNILSNDIRGFNFDDKSNKLYDIVYGNVKSNLNIFQIYFKLSGMTWKGEGYDVNYIPRNKSKKNRTGIAIANANLRNYIIDKLKLDITKLWIVPFKKNIFKKIDEINRVNYLITDDFLSMNIGLFVRKNIYFLETIPYNTRLEFFGTGESYQVPFNITK
jgi:hypothetical protein